jgi:hypothetical protein
MWSGVMAGVGHVNGNVNLNPLKRGVKRPADESIEHEHGQFTKRFNLLSLGKAVIYVDRLLETNDHIDRSANDSTNSNYYIPVSPPATTHTNGSTNTYAAQNDSMHVDSTPNRVYIHNLDEELADIEASEPEEQLIFLPDIEKHFSRIPQQLLTGRQESIEDQALVLYSVPKSLTVDEGHDSVRRAILEARQRAREKALDEARHEEMGRKYGQAGNGEDEVAETAHGYGQAGYEEANVDDPDAMEM